MTVSDPNLSEIHSRFVRVRIVLKLIGRPYDTKQQKNNKKKGKEGRIRKQSHRKKAKTKEIKK
jgi:hypothetical protein